MAKAYRLLVAAAIACAVSCASPPKPAPAASNALVEPFEASGPAGRIAGEVHYASAARPRSALILVGGSSVRTGADTASAVPLFISDQVAVVLYDRRGNGGSEGTFEIPNTENTAWQIPRFGADVASIATHLKRRGFETVGLAGSSMGGWVNVAAAARSHKVDFIVCLSGAASTVGVSDEFDRLTDQGLSIAEATERARGYRGAQGYDPAPDFRRMTQPGLWVFGAEDDSNPTTLDVAALDAQRAAGRDFAYIVLPGADHELTDVRSGEFNTDWIAPVQAFIADHSK